MADTPPKAPNGPSGLGQVRHLAKHSALLLSSGLLSYLGSLALYVLLARSLGQRAFGVWAVAFSVANTLATFGLVGADWVVTRHGAYYHGIGDLPRLRRTIHFALTLSGIGLGFLGAALLLMAPLVARDIFHEASLTPMLRVVAVMTPVMGMGQVLLFGTQAFKNMRDFALVRNILQPSARLGFAALALAISATGFSALIGLFCAEVLLATASLYALNRRLPLVGPTEPIEEKELVRFALPAWGTRLIDQTRTQLFPLLLGSLAAFSASGAFVASQRIAVAPSSIIVALNQVYRPMGSNLYLQRRHLELADLCKSIGKWSFALAFPLFCFQMAFPAELLSLFGESFEGAIPALLLLGISMLFNFATGPVGTTLIMVGKSRLALIDHVLVIAVEIGLGFWLIPTQGLIGAAIARVVGAALNNLLRLAQVHWVLKIHPYRVDYWKPLAAGIGSVAVAKGIVTGLSLSPTSATALLAVAILTAAYIAFLMILGLSPDDRAAIDAFRMRMGGGARSA